MSGKRAGDLEFSFWDTSALIPLCVDQSTTDRALSLAKQFGIVVWWGSTVEVHSAVARLHRSRHLSEATKQYAINSLEVLRLGWREIQPDESIRGQAADQLYKHPLRAADSLQLAAALSWCKGRTSGRTFICSDIRLSDAASREGFLVVQP